MCRRRSTDSHFLPDGEIVQFDPPAGAEDDHRRLHPLAGDLEPCYCALLMSGHQGFSTVLDLRHHHQVEMRERHR